MRIDYVSMPDIQGKTLEQAIMLLYDHCREEAELIMQLNNEVEDLKQKVADLEQRQ